MASREQQGAGPAYIACGECGYLYRTRRDLRRAYRRAALRAMRCDEPRWYWPYQGLRILFHRTDRILFCQVCLHDL